MTTEYFSSDFEPFGMLEFSSEEPLAQRIYNSLREDMGPAFQQFDQDAETYADAMCLAISQLQIESASAQMDPDQVNYLITEIEKDFMVIPRYAAALEERRTNLALLMRSAWRGTTAVITAGLAAILGADLYGWRFMRMTGDASNEVTPSTLTPTISPPSTPIKLATLTGTVFPGVTTVGYTMLLDAGKSLIAGDKITVDPENLAAVELVTVTNSYQLSATTGTITATFAKCHGPTMLATTATSPLWVSNKCHAIIVVADSVLSDGEKVARIHSFMSKVAPATSTWAICQATATTPALQTGPFRVGQGRVGQTPISTVAISV